MPYDFDLLGIFLGNKCNLSCPHCLPKSHIGEKGRLTEDEQELLIAAACDFDVSMISFTGGEPLLFYRDDIINIVSATPNKARIRITTNGSFLLQRDWPRYLDLKVDELRVSYDRFHGNLNLHRRLSKLKEFCEQREIRFVLEMIVASLDDLRYLADHLPENLKSDVRTDLALKAGRARETECFFKPLEFVDTGLAGGCPSLAQKVLMYYQGRGFTVCCNNISESSAIPSRFRYFNSVIELTESRLFNYIKEIRDFKSMVAQVPALHPEHSLKCNLCDTLVTETFSHSRQEGSHG